MSHRPNPERISSARVPESKLSHCVPPQVGGCDVFTTRDVFGKLAIPKTGMSLFIIERNAFAVSSADHLNAWRSCGLKKASVVPTISNTSPSADFAVP